MSLFTFESLLDLLRFLNLPFRSRYFLRRYRILVDLHLFLRNRNSDGLLGDGGGIASLIIHWGPLNNNFLVHDRNVYRFLFLYNIFSDDYISSIDTIFRNV